MFSEKCSLIINYYAIWKEKNISSVIHMIETNHNRLGMGQKVIKDKGGLISESLSVWLKSPKMDAKSLPWALLVDSAQGMDLAPIFGDLSKSEKLSDIKPPLVIFGLKTGSDKIIYWLSSWVLLFQKTKRGCVLNFY